MPGQDAIFIKQTSSADFGTYIVRIEAVLDDRAGTKSSATMTVDIVECKPANLSITQMPNLSLLVGLSQPVDASNF